MPLAPQFVQEVSENTLPNYGFKHKNFVNMSSQQLTPGTLPHFFRSQNQAEPMPFALADINVPNAPIVQQINEANNVSNLPKAETMPFHFEQDVQSKLRRFRTSNMRAWGVPLSMTEMRATDAMY